MCTCIGEVEKEISNSMTVKGKKIFHARLQKAYMLDGRSKLILIAKVEVEGMRNEQSINIFFNYCPFCGKKYEV